MSGERCDVAVVGAGLVGLALAYELACLGATRDRRRRRAPGAGHRRRRGHPVAGRPARRPTTPLWPFLRQAGATTRPCWRAWRPTARTSTGTGYGRCGILSIGLRAARGRVVRPLRRAGAAPGARRGGRDHARGGRLALPAPRARCTACCTRRRSARVDGRGMAAALRQAARGAGRRVRAGAVARRRGGGRRRRGTASTPCRGRGHGPVACGAVAVAGGAWTAAAGEWLGYAPARRPDEGADRASRRRGRRRTGGRSCSRC